MEEWIKKMLYIYTIKYYSTIRKYKILPFALTEIDLEIITLNQVRQGKTNIIEYHLHVES